MTMHSVQSDEAGTHLSPCQDALDQRHAAHEVVQRQEAQLNGGAPGRIGREGVLHMTSILPPDGQDRHYASIA